MKTVGNWIEDPQTGAILCATCYEEAGVAYEMAACERLYGYACDETENGHFLPAKCVLSGEN